MKAFFSPVESWNNAKLNGQLLHGGGDPGPETADELVLLKVKKIKEVWRNGYSRFAGARPESITCTCTQCASRQHCLQI